MSEPLAESDHDFIDVGPRRRRRAPWLIGAVVILLILLSRSLSVFLSAAWFNSLGFSAVYWYIFKLKAGLFLLFAVVTAVGLRAVFWLVARGLSSQPLSRRTIIVNNQPIQFSPERFIGPGVWVVSVLLGLFYGFAMKSEWQTFALYFHQAGTPIYDPVFG